MAKRSKEEKIKKTNCDESCNCGCNEGNECNCEETHEEVKTEESGCAGSCEGCSGCGTIDPEMVIQILESRNKELEEKYMRLQAEYLNFKTRTQSEISKMLQYEGESFIKEILVVKDNLERAIMMDDNDLSDEVSKFLSGFEILLLY